MKAAKGDDEKISMITDHISQLLNEVCYIWVSFRGILSIAIDS